MMVANQNTIIEIVDKTGEYYRGQKQRDKEIEQICNQFKTKQSKNKDINRDIHLVMRDSDSSASDQKVKFILKKKKIKQDYPIDYKSIRK